MAVQTGYGRDQATSTGGDFLSRSCAPCGAKRREELGGEIPVDIDRSAVNRGKGGIATVWCAECAAEVMAVTPTKAAALAFTDLRTIYLWIELGTVHFAEIGAGDHCISAST